jgi:hypothetical protein
MCEPRAPGRRSGTHIEALELDYLPSHLVVLGGRKRERICWGTEGSNPSPSSSETTANPTSSGADDPECFGRQGHGAARPPASAMSDAGDPVGAETGGDVTPFRTTQTFRNASRAGAAGARCVTIGSASRLQGDEPGSDPRSVACPSIIRQRRSERAVPGSHVAQCGMPTGINRRWSQWRFTTGILIGFDRSTAFSALAAGHSGRPQPRLSA